jgi:hypothetical protein
LFIVHYQLSQLAAADSQGVKLARTGAVLEQESPEEGDSFGQIWLVIIFGGFLDGFG